MPAQDLMAVALRRHLHEQLEQGNTGEPLDTETVMQRVRERAQRAAKLRVLSATWLSSFLTWLVLRCSKNPRPHPPPQHRVPMLRPPSLMKCTPSSAQVDVKGRPTSPVS